MPIAESRGGRTSSHQIRLSQDSQYRLQFAALMFGFFALLAVNTAFHPWANDSVQSGPLNVMDSLVNTAMVSWMGQKIAASVLAALAIVAPLYAWRSRSAFFH